MKKVLLTLAAVLIGTAAFAQDFKVSAGPTLGFQWINYGVSYSILGITGTGNLNAPTFNFGVFFDATYVEAKVGYLTEIGKSNNTATISGTTVSATSDDQLGFLNIGIAGKLPIKLSDMIVLFPKVGFDYNIYMNSNPKYTGSVATDLNDLFLLLGLGVDIYVAKTIYIRPEGSFDINLTATPSSANAVSGVTYTGNKINAGVSVGFVF